MKLQYSYSDCWIYFHKLFKNVTNSDRRIEELKRDIILLCATSVEDFWADFYLKKFTIYHYRKRRILIKKYIFDWEPVAYLLKKTRFSNSSLIIKKGIFIPQADTELVIDTLVMLAKKIWREDYFDSLMTLEIGTGSGAISISLAKIFSKWKFIYNSNSCRTFFYFCSIIGIRIRCCSNSSLCVYRFNMLLY